MSASTELDGMKIGLVLALLFVVCAGYALLLQTRKGRLLAERRTWVTVVIGDSLVLVALAVLLPWHNVLLAFFAFAAAGIPIILRAIYNELTDEQDAVRGMRQ